ncbi:hypothetical protein [Streptomyces sp. NPDC050538]|uniref:hypothetical protein n=1 Tax=Streptomyces sp. NPDC050538 TaxID=3365627 RepID=UPI0037BACF7B
MGEFVAGDQGTDAGAWSYRKGVVAAGGGEARQRGAGRDLGLAAATHDYRFGAAVEAGSVHAADRRDPAH